MKGSHSKGDLFGWKGLIKVAFNSPILNLEGPILNFKVSARGIMRGVSRTKYLFLDDIHHVKRNDLLNDMV